MIALHTAPVAIVSDGRRDAARAGVAGAPAPFDARASAFARSAASSLSASITAFAAIDRCVGGTAEAITRTVAARRERRGDVEAASARARDLRVLQGEPLLDARFVRRSDDLAEEELWEGEALEA